MKTMETTYTDPQRDEYTLWYTADGAITHTASDDRGWSKSPFDISLGAGSTGSEWLDEQFRNHIAKILSLASQQRGALMANFPVNLDESTEAPTIHPPEDAE